MQGGQQANAVGPGDGVERAKGKVELVSLASQRPTVASSKNDPETLEIDEVAEKKLVRKLDLHIVPMVMLLYLLVCPVPASRNGLLAIPQVDTPCFESH